MLAFLLGLAEAGEGGDRKYQKADARQREKNAYRGRARHEARTLFMKTE
ncbi:TPA: hypothetical protein L4V08_005327 [Pseudomonas aeruginosa]|nr:hypothetical protein [Pseudomonas aeruginosa]